MILWNRVLAILNLGKLSVLINTHSMFNLTKLKTHIWSGVRYVIFEYFNIRQTTSTTVDHMKN